MSARTFRNAPVDFTDLWVTPRNGRVVFDERGNSVWQWPSSDDPFSRTSANDMNAEDLRVVEPAEYRRSRLPWVHESERAAKEIPSPVETWKRRK